MHILISAVSSARRPSGICRHAANLATASAGARDASAVTLLLGEWQIGYFRNAFGLADAISIVPVAMANNPCARNVWYYLTLPKIARELRADVVHLSFPAPIRRSAFVCPVVSSLHDLYPYDAPRNFGQLRVFFNRAFLRQCLNGSDAVVCSSSFTLDRLRLHAPQLASRKALRIYQSVALDPRDERSPDALELRDRSFLLAVAQHRSNKNLDLLLSAFAELRGGNSGQNLRLIIVGAEGPETCKLHSLVRQLSLDAYVVFRSALSDAELCWLYRRCELLVVPSSVEGFCFPVVEGLRCGARVLCSDIPVLREIGGSHCNYFDLNQQKPATALANAIQAALRQPAPEPHLSDEFSWRETARQYWAVYSGLLAGDDSARVRAETPPFEPVPYDRQAN